MMKFRRKKSNKNIQEKKLESTQAHLTAYCLSYEIGLKKYFKKK